MLLLDLPTCSTHPLSPIPPSVLSALPHTYTQLGLLYLCHNPVLNYVVIIYMHVPLFIKQ